MWLMILIAVHMSDPQDIPGRVVLEFDNREQCERVLSTMSYWLKFERFRVEGKCIKKF